MKKLILFSFLMFQASLTLFSQNPPEIKVGKKKLDLAKLNLDVKIAGNLATTTFELFFYNPNDERLEGELNFPLGEGREVSRFALDINGKLREAVIVEKEKARVAFESTVRRRIDPALLEKTQGNNYKARIFPIEAKSYKRVVLAYDEELILNKGELFYQLPLEYDLKLDNFNLKISVAGIDDASILKSNLKFESSGGNLVSEIEKENFKLDQDFIFRIAKNDSKPTFVAQDDFFYWYNSIEAKERIRPKPSKISIFWDVSYSEKDRQIQKEIDLLKSYFEYLRKVEVEIITFDYKERKKSTFKVENGDSKALFEFLKSLIYDGGTAYNKLDFNSEDSEAILLFSDGLDNFGGFKEEFNSPIFAINSKTSADHKELQQVSLQSGGNYINLKNSGLEEAISKLKNQPLLFLGATSEDNSLEIYPKEKKILNKDFTLTGKGFENTTITLKFGFGNEVVNTIEINPVDAIDVKDWGIDKKWANQKIDFLNVQNEDLEAKIVEVSEDYQVLSDYTSLLVLDRLSDYIEYEVTPPDEMLAEYQDAMRRKKSSLANHQNNLKAKRLLIIDGYNDIQKWYGKTPKIDISKDTISQRTNDPVTNVVDSGEEAPDRESSLNSTSNSNSGEDIPGNENSNHLVKGNVKAAGDDFALPGVNVIVKGTSNGVQADFDGNYQIYVDEGEKLIFSYIGFETQEVVVTGDLIDVELEENASTLNEVVVMGYESESSNTRTSAVTELQGRIAGIQVVNDEEEIVSIRGAASLSNKNPIYIVNGNLVSEMPNLDADDIAEFYNINSENATKLYGAQAAGGVVVIKTKELSKKEKDKITELELKIKDELELKGWNPNSAYIRQLKRTNSAEEAYQLYLQLREEYNNMPSFYMDVADYFLSQKETEKAFRIISNIAEIELDNYELSRALAYKLEAEGKTGMAEYIYTKVLELRPEDIQSYRDMALIKIENGHFQEALELLYKIVSGELVEKDEARRFSGIEDISFVEMNNLITLHKNELDLSNIDKKFISPMKMDLRVVVDWNHNDTDIDLWVIDPKNEKCWYKSKKTKIGGKLSDDMTEGFGPESFKLKEAISGNYEMFIDYYSDNVQKISGPTFLKITVFKNYGTKDQQKTLKVYRLENSDDELKVGEINF
ncbi:VIT domain-containing protein [Zunongwangia sp. HRR-M8]|uniref:VIT domain-containing protein n=1 Tax=Zunongwangia sp. HRR-M8 TaxID=3015170 RepID=UPI0022DD4936|nr:VIT domain-containing protein [Zunongwangia sp. HRR-M8]WBL21059.1 VIT domain-containing protein [Zunongwangia sp. HRR-M8]